MLQGMDISPEGWEHIGGGGILVILVIREVLRHMSERREKGNPQTLVGEMTAEQLEAKVRHVVRNELAPVVLKINEGNIVLAGKVDESNKRLETINNSMVKLITIFEQRRSI